MEKYNNCSIKYDTADKIISILQKNLELYDAKTCKLIKTES